MLGGIAANHRRQTHLFDSLESRVLLAVIPVDTFDDVVNPTDHRTSLREALVRAATTAGDDRIIVPAGRYPLALGELFIDDQTGTVRIRSTRGAAVIDAQQKSRVMWIRPQSVVEMTGIVITEGRSPSSSTHSGDIGGGVLNSGTLTMTDCRITRNASGNGAMNDGIGGGLYSEG